VRAEHGEFISKLTGARWCGDGLSEGVARRQSSPVRVVLELGERRRRAGACAVVARVVLALL
jgi:hypothetical protein